VSFDGVLKWNEINKYCIDVNFEIIRFAAMFVNLRDTWYFSVE